MTPEQIIIKENKPNAKVRNPYFVNGRAYGICVSHHTLENENSLGREEPMITSSIIQIFEDGSFETQNTYYEVVN